MDKLLYTLACLFLSAVLGGTWGGLLAWLYPTLALPVALVLFVLCFVVLMNANRDIEEEEFPQHNRRFNDV